MNLPGILILVSYIILNSKAPLASHSIFFTLDIWLLQGLKLPTFWNSDILSVICSSRMTALSLLHPHAKVLAVVHIIPMRGNDLRNWSVAKTPDKFSPSLTAVSTLLKRRGLQRQRTNWFRDYRIGIVSLGRLKGYFTGKIRFFWNQHSSSMMGIHPKCF